MKQIMKLVFTFIGIFLLMQCSTSPQPPMAQKIAHTDTVLNTVLEDDYFWLRERDNPEVRAYLEAENAYTETMMAPTKGLQNKLYKEMVARIKEDDASVPYKDGPYFYYSRTEQGKQYPIYCRKKGSLQADEEIYFDTNKMGADKPYFRLGVLEVSPNHKLLAYSVDTLGNESYTIHFRNLETGKDFSDAIPGTYYSLAWANDNQTVFYTVLDAATRPYKVLRHRIGRKVEDDVVVHHEKDEKFFLETSRSKSGRYIFISAASQITSEDRFIPADKPTAKFTVVAPRINGVQYYTGHHGRDFYIRTNEDALDFKLMKTRTNRLAKKYWKEVVPAREGVTLSSVELFKNYLVLAERQNGLEQLRYRSFGSKKFATISFDEALYTVRPTNNIEFDTPVLRYSYSSLKTPNSVYDFDMGSGQRTLRKQQEVPNFNADDYQVERIFATAQDGAQIPISLVYKKDMQRNGQNPLYLYGYGSYGINIKPRFSSRRFSLVDRGFVYAIAHIRGSSTMGRAWYENGKLLHKRNTFTDFIACAEHLINEKYTTADKMVTSGGSAGGLLMGAVLNMRPDLFKAAVAHVPFVDVINTMLDETIPLTVIEYEEWGNPHLEKYFHYMRSYSPYDNVEAKNYPNILITAGLNDPRVQYWEPAKWTAKLRALKTDDNWLLLKTNMGAGHGGASGRYDYLKEVAFEYAFLLNRLGLDK